MADVDGLVGAACSIVCQPVGLLAASWNIPMVSFSCTSGSLADKETYPTFTRTCPNMIALLPGAFAATIDAFGSVSLGTFHTMWQIFLEILQMHAFRNVVQCSLMYHPCHDHLLTYIFSI